MSEKEAELGYPSSAQNQNGRREGPISFTLPSLSSIDLPRPTPSLPAKSDGLRLSQAKSISPIPTGFEVEDEECQNEKMSSPSPSSSPVGHRSSFSGPTLPVPETMSTPPPPSTFSTWVPDGSLRFINPDFLSSAEKQTLEQQLGPKDVGTGTRGKRKEWTDGTEDGEKRMNNEAEWEEGKRARKMGRPLPFAQDDNLTEAPPTLATILSPRGRPSTFPSTAQRTRSRPPLNSSMWSSSMPSMGGRPGEMDLLRQVKSNNLSMPSQSAPYQHPVRPQMNWVPPGYIAQNQYPHARPRNYPQYQHQPSQHYPPYNKHPQHRKRQDNSLFTYAPLYHPPQASAYTYRPGPAPAPIPAPQSQRSKRPDITQTTSTEIHTRDRNYSPAIALPASSTGSNSNSVPAAIENTVTSSIGSLAALELPDGDWRRNYVGRGRGQSGG